MSAETRWPFLGRSISYREAVALQERMRRRMTERGRRGDPRTVAGVDVSVRDGQARAAVVVLEFPSLRLVQAATAELPAEFPYLPGLLSFREVPAILGAFAGLEERPDLLFVDGHGKIHPRRFGIACFLGVELGLPSIGIGKSPFVGDHREPGSRRGSSTQVRDRGEVLGKALRTRDGVRPIYVSVGHRVDLATAQRLTLRCTGRYRLPEPIRAAHRTAGAARPTY